LGSLMARGQVRRFAPETPVVASDPPAGWAFLVLSGSCRLQRRLPEEAGREILRTFKRGETFGGLLLPDTHVIATEDSSVFCIRLQDLAELVPKVSRRRPAGSPATDDSARFAFTPDAPEGKIVMLAFFSDSLPGGFLAEQIAQRLRSETAAAVLLLQLVASGDEPADCVLNDDPDLPTELPEVADGVRRLRIRLPGEPPAPEVWGGLFGRLRCRFDYVLLDVSAERIPMSVLFESIKQTRTAYFFLRRSSGDLYHLDRFLHEVRPALSGRSTIELKSVLCLAGNESVGGFDARIERAGISSQFFIRQCPMSAGTGMAPGASHPDIRRIARSIGDCLVGLALSSGAAKGFAHVGVLQVLEENGVEPDVVAGSSMGAYVGALWAFGCDGAKLEKLARDMEVKWALWNLIDPVFPPRQGVLSGHAIKRRLQQTIGDAQFSDLLRPLLVLATNLDTLARVVFSSGDVATAVHTSIAVPGIFVPIRIGEESFIDGGIVDPLPVDVLQEMGVRKIIAVNAIPSSDRIRACQQAQREVARNTERRARRLAKKFLPLNQHMNYFARGNILEILMHSIHGAQIRMAEANGRQADVVLQPDICSDRWVDYRNPGQYIRAGREVALRKLDEIKAVVQEKGTPHEIKPAPEAMAAVA